MDARAGGAGIDDEAVEPGARIGELGGAVDAEGGGEDVVEEGGDAEEGGGREDEELGAGFLRLRRLGREGGRGEGVHAGVELRAVRRDVGRGGG